VVELDAWRIYEADVLPLHALQAHQLAAVAAPQLSLKQLAAVTHKPPRKALPNSHGNFEDLESLLAQLGSSPIIELGKPLPNEKHLPKTGVGRCQAAHNRGLLGEKRD
jgi:hypothetical protein